MARVKRYLGDMVNGKVGNVVFFQLNGEMFVKTVQNRNSDRWAASVKNKYAVKPKTSLPHE